MRIDKYRYYLKRGVDYSLTTKQRQYARNFIRGFEGHEKHAGAIGAKGTAYKRGQSHAKDVLQIPKS